MLSGIEEFDSAIANFAVILPRLGAAFIILPLLTSEVVPSMIRNVLIVTLSLVVYPLVAPTIDSNAMAALSLPMIIIKEVFIGLLIGFTFSVLFWALEMAGQIIDAKVGATTAQLNDPLAGHQTSLTGSLLSRFGSWLFVASGGLLIFIDVVLSSYTVWPVAKMLPALSPNTPEFVIARIHEMLLLSVLIAAPALVLMTMIDVGMGFMNKFAQQLNVFSLSMPLKALISIWMILILLATVADFTFEHLGSLKNLLQALAVSM